MTLIIHTQAHNQTIMKTNNTNRKKLFILLPLAAICWYTGSHIYSATKAPDINIMTPKHGASVSSEATTITGSTTPGAQVKINNVPVPVSENGNFSSTVALIRGHVATYKIQAQDRRGRSSSKTISVVSDYPRSEELVMTGN